MALISFRNSVLLYRDNLHQVRLDFISSSIIHLGGLEMR